MPRWHLRGPDASSAHRSAPLSFCEGSFPMRAQTTRTAERLFPRHLSEAKLPPSKECRWRMMRRAAFKSRHSFLFLACLTLYLGVPLVEESGSSGIAENIFTLGLMATSLAVLSKTRRLTRLGAVICGTLIICTLIEYYLFPSGLELIEGILLPLFYVTVLTAVVRNLIKESQINLDHILGAVAGYFILGFMWAEIYDLLLLFNPQAIRATSGALLTKSQMFYFSFSTLVTIGYGDIVPAAGLARNIAVLGGISGQLYLAILIARLVGLHLHSTVTRARNAKRRP